MLLDDLEYAQNNLGLEGAEYGQIVHTVKINQVVAGAGITHKVYQVEVYGDDTYEAVVEVANGKSTVNTEVTYGMGEALPGEYKGKLLRYLGL